MKNDIDATEDNISILKRNINNFLRDNNMTQEDLGAEIGLTQSRVSLCLNEANSNCFTLDQIINIAKAHNLSLDDLFGITQKQESKEEKDDATVSDVFKKLFELDEVVGLRIEHFQVYDDSPEQAEIIISNPHVLNLLFEWEHIQKLPSTDINGKLLELWKESVLNDYTRIDDQDHFC